MRSELNTFAQHRKVAERIIWQYDVKKKLRAKNWLV